MSETIGEIYKIHDLKDSPLLNVKQLECDDFRNLGIIKELDFFEIYGEKESYFSYGEQSFYSEIAEKAIYSLNLFLKKRCDESSILSEVEVLQLMLELGELRFQIASKSNSLNQQSFGQIYNDESSSVSTEIPQTYQAKLYSLAIETAGLPNGSVYVRSNHLKINRNMLSQVIVAEEAEKDVESHIFHEGKTIQTWKAFLDEFTNLLNQFVVQKNWDDKDARLSMFAEIFWLHSNFMPYIRGSAAICDWWLIALDMIFDNPALMRNNCFPNHFLNFVPFILSLGDFKKYLKDQYKTD